MIHSLASRSALAFLTLLLASVAVKADGFCDALKDLRTPLKSEDNPFIQQLTFTGRFHYQWSHTEGERNGIDFDQNGGELRRLWAGVKFKALGNFDGIASFIFNEGGFRDDGAGYNRTDFLNLNYNFGDVGPFKKLRLGYGRYKVDFSREWHFGNNTLRNVERTPVSTYFTPPRTTGVKASAVVNGVKLVASVATTDRDDTWGQWKGGVAYYLSGSWEALKGKWWVDAYYIDADNQAERDLFIQDKSLSIAYERVIDRWTLMVNGIYGDIGDNDFYGIVLMPSVFLWEDKLEAVLAYSYGKSGGDDLRAPNRAVRQATGSVGVGSGRGDQTHYLYAGLNYYTCGRSAKAGQMMLLGLEYNDVQGSTENLDALTLWTNYRIYF